MGIGKGCQGGVESLSLEMVKGRIRMWHSVPWSVWQGGVGSQVGLHGLKDLSQPRWFCALWGCIKPIETRGVAEAWPFSPSGWVNTFNFKWLSIWHPQKWPAVPYYTPGHFFMLSANGVSFVPSALARSSSGPLHLNCCIHSQCLWM